MPPVDTPVLVMNAPSPEATVAIIDVAALGSSNMSVSWPPSSGVYLVDNPTPFHFRSTGGRCNARTFARSVMADATDG